MMSIKKYQPVLIFAFLATLVLSAVECSRTKAFYDLMQRQPLMTFECYRSGETIEPAGAVNFAILWDGTKPKNTQAIGTTWYETRGQLDSYVKGNFTTMYDDLSGVGILTSGTQKETVEIVLPPFNDAAYYMKLTLTGKKDRVVYKIYDKSGTCSNAATLFFKTCYDVKDECCSQPKSCEGQGVSLSKPRQELGCSKLQFSRYPQAEPFPVCADYHSCT